MSQLDAYYAMKIGFISTFPPADRRASSGTNFKVAQALSEIGEVCWIPAIPPRYYRYIELFVKALAKLVGRKVCFNYTCWGAKMIASSVDVERFSTCDILIAFWQGSSLAYLDTKGKPVIYLSDATFPAMIDYYPPFCHLFKWNIKQGIQIERQSLDKASAIVLSSDWSAASAINDLHQPKEKVHVIEFGANIDDKDIIQHSFQFQGHLDILFMGVEWGRKGGEVAVEAVRWLNENGIDSTLHIVGIRNLDKQIASLPYVDYAGFLNKNILGEYQKFVDIIQKCHLLLLPTKAECAGIAFCEASAYGLPVFTYETGGIPNYIQNGVNGYMLSIGSTGEDFGRKVKSSLHSGELERMSQTAVKIYRTKLNWGVWQHRMKKIILSMVSCHTNRDENGAI